MNVVKEAVATGITKVVNKFTGQEETKAVFSLSGFDYENAFDIWTPQYTVTFNNSATGGKETYSSYDDSDVSQIVGRVSFFQESYESASVSGNADVILYYPYWIGGIYRFSDTGSKNNYYLTEAEYLGNERFAYASYTKGTGSFSTGNFKERQYSFTYFVADAPEKPSGVPTVQVAHSGDDAILSWNKISGATGYRIYITTESGWMEVIDDTSNATYTVNKNILYEFSEMGYGDVQIKICAYAENKSIWKMVYSQESYCKIKSDKMERDENLALFAGTAL